MLISSRLATAFAIICLGAPAAAHAGVTFSSTAFDAAPSAGQTLVLDFDSPPAAGYNFSGGGVYQGLTPNVAAPPAGDQTKYAAVLGGETATLSSSLDLASLSLYIGSIDQYNTITFSGSNGFSQNLTGADLYHPADGDQSSADTNRRFDFSFDDVAVDKVTFQSSGNSFEFDNIAATPVSAAPEPEAWALMMLGVAMIGGMIGMHKRASVDPRTSHAHAA